MIADHSPLITTSNVTTVYRSAVVMAPALQLEFQVICFKDYHASTHCPVYSTFHSSRVMSHDKKRLTHPAARCAITISSCAPELWTMTQMYGTQRRDSAIHRPCLNTNTSDNSTLHRPAHYLRRKLQLLKAMIGRTARRRRVCNQHKSKPEGTRYSAYPATTHVVTREQQVR